MEEKDHDSPPKASTARFAGVRRCRQDAAKRCQCFKMGARTSRYEADDPHRLRDQRASPLQWSTTLPLHIACHRHAGARVPAMWSASETKSLRSRAVGLRRHEALCMSLLHGQ